MNTKRILRQGATTELRSWAHQNRNAPTQAEEILMEPIFLIFTALPISWWLKWRDEYLTCLGFRIIRLTNDEVLRDLFNALQKIKEATTA